ncbi:hypothetical protein ACFLZI_01115 [Nitrospirota bacterium]
MDIININPGLGIVIMMNNYFHDVATALLMSSGIVLWIMYRRYKQQIAESGETEELTLFFLNMYEGMTNVAKFSLIWILVGGVPRTLFYRSFEWSNAVAHAQIPALIAKHVMVFTFVGTGVFLWHKFNTEVKQIKKARAEKESE